MLDVVENPSVSWLSGGMSFVFEDVMFRHELRQRSDGAFVEGTRVPGKEQLRPLTAKTLAIKQAARLGRLDELDSPQRMPSLQTTLDSPPPIGRFDSRIMSPSHPLATMCLSRDRAR